MIQHRFNPRVIRDYLASGAWQPEVDSLRLVSQEMPDRIAVVDRGRRITYAQFNELVDRAALALLDLGIQLRATLVYQIPNWLEHYLLLHATRRAGIRSVGADMSLRHRDLAWVLDATGAQWLVLPQRFRHFDFSRMARDLQAERPDLRVVLVGAVDEDDPTAGAVIFNELLARQHTVGDAQARLAARAFAPDEVNAFKLTSGSTGRPKLAMQLGYQAVARQTALVERFQLSADDVFLIMAPLTGGGGRVLGVWSAHPLGARTVLLDRFDPSEALRLIERERVTVTSGVPTQYVKLLEAMDSQPHDLSSLRAVFYTGSRLPAEVGRRYAEDLGVALLGVYGTQDAGIFSCTAVTDDLDVALQTVGQPFPDVDAQVQPEDGTPLPADAAGELRFGGPGVLLAGYYQGPDATARAFDADGYFSTGDFGAVRSDGRVVVKGRRGETINRGGYKVYPAEIEELLLEHPAIKHAAVVGYPDPVFGQRACLFAVSSGQTLPCLEDVVRFLRTKGVAPYKLPETLRILDELPLIGDTQKIDRRGLEALAMDGVQTGLPPVGSR